MFVATADAAPPGGVDADETPRAHRGELPYLRAREVSGYMASDNERPARGVHLGGFEIDAAPVTHREDARFIADGGHRRRHLRSSEGWRWRTMERAPRRARDP